jgi:hypothetical protein
VILLTWLKDVASPLKQFPLMREIAPSLVVNANRLALPMRRRGDRLVDAAQTMEALHHADRTDRVRAGILTWTAPIAALACGLVVFAFVALQLVPRFLFPIQAALNWLSAI